MLKISYRFPNNREMPRLFFQTISDAKNHRPDHQRMSGIKKFARLSLLFAVVIFFDAMGIFGSHPALAKYIQLDGAADVKTRYSQGCSTVQEIATLAEQAGIDAVFFNDRARDALQYGIYPFERLIKKNNERPSILSTSAPVYISDIRDKDKQFRETLLFPGIDVSPFYFWTGSVFKKNLVAHNWDKRLSIIGLENGADIEQLPILDSNFSKKYSAKFQNAFIGYGLLLVIALIVIAKGYYPKIAIPLAVFFLLLIFNNHPFRSSAFDQYHGDRGIKPYQEVIDYAVSRGAMVFWNDVDAFSGKRNWGTVNLETLPHSESLVLSRGYTGFQAVAEQPVSITAPGNVWDHVLVQYIREERDHPVWGYGANDFQCAGETGPVLGAARTIFLVREKSHATVMDAMRKGRMYAVRQPGAHRLSLDEFTVRDTGSGQEAIMGEKLVATDFPEVSIKIHSTDGVEKRGKIFLIRNGKVVKRESISLPYELQWVDNQLDMIEPVYYRVNVQISNVDHLVSNPVFVNFGKTSSVAASISTPPEKEDFAQEPVQPTLETPQAPEAPQIQKTESPQLARLEPPELKTAPEIPAPAPVTPPAETQPPAPPVSAAKPQSPQAEFSTAQSGEQYLRVLIDGASLKKGPGAVFPEMEKANKGDRLLFVRRTNILFNGKAWLVVKSGDRQAYVWEGLVEKE